MVSSRVLSRAPAPPKAGGARYERKGWLVFPGLRRGRPAPPAEFGARAPVSAAARVWTRYGVRMERSAHSSGSTVPAGDTGRTGAHGAEWAAAPRAGPPRAHRFDPGD